MNDTIPSSDFLRNKTVLQEQWVGKAQENGRGEGERRPVMPRRRGKELSAEDEPLRPGVPNLGVTNWNRSQSVACWEPGCIE